MIGARRGSLVSKCALIRFSKSSPTIAFSYVINGSQIPVTEKHKDLGLVVTSNLSWSDHYNHMTSKAYRILGLLRRTFSMNNSVDAKKLLYTSLVRSQLIYCSPIWRPHLIKDIVKLEKLQRRATKYILSDFISDYKTRLITLKLLPLMYYLELSDMTFCLNNLKSPSINLSILDYVSFSVNPTRSGGSNKMVHSRSMRNTVQHQFFNRLPRLWNAFPPIDRDLSVACNKQKLKNFLMDHFLINFDPQNPCSYHFMCPCSKCSHIPQSPNF